MRFSRPPGVIAGFHAATPDPEVPELVHCGEQWAAKHYFIQTHEHNVWEIYLQAAGASTWNAEGKVYEIETGGLFSVPPGVVHSMHERPDSNHHYFYAAIDVESITARNSMLAGVWKSRGVFVVPGAATVAVPFRQLMREVSTSHAFQSIGIRSTMYQLLIEVSRLLAEQDNGKANAAQENPFMHPAVARARELLIEHPSRDWGVSDLARLAGVSSGHLAEMFTRDVGVAPHAFLVQQRMETAQYQLSTSDIPITQIAIELGFSSSQHFATAFRKAIGCTPREFRRRTLSSQDIRLMAP